MALVYIEKLPEAQRLAFAAKVQEIANWLDILPDWLMQIMYAESGLKPTAQNAATKATGLIQFMPATAKLLGTSTDALRNMSALQQLDYVKKYFAGYRYKLHSYYDVYSVVFFPAIIGKPDSWILQTKTIKPDTLARQNPIMDYGKKGFVTVADFQRYVSDTIPAHSRPAVLAVKKKSLASSTYLVPLVVTFLIVFVICFQVIKTNKI
jgi:hypothetical protein